MNDGGQVCFIYFFAECEVCRGRVSDSTTVSVSFTLQSFSFSLILSPSCSLSLCFRWSPSTLSPLSLHIVHLRAPEPKNENNKSERAKVTPLTNSNNIPFYDDLGVVKNQLKIVLDYYDVWKHIPALRRLGIDSYRAKLVPYIVQCSNIVIYSQMRGIFTTRMKYHVGITCHEV